MWTAIVLLFISFWFFVGGYFTIKEQGYYIEMSDLIIFSFFSVVVGGSVCFLVLM